MARVGLVLGAGGVVGHAFHAGVLAALADETGWDPRGAEVIVGTSAGSIVGALLRAGFAARDLHEEARAGRPSWRTRRRLQRGEQPPAPLPAVPPAADVFGAIASPRLVARALAAPWAVRPGVVAAALLPAGSRSTDVIADRLGPLVGTRWPSRDLWVCAVELDHGKRVVFGRDRVPAVDLVTALSASCAIPGFFTPVAVGGARYVDGGVHSPTNADLLAGQDLDLVVVSSPMSHTGTWPAIGLDAPARAFARVELRREERKLRAAGTPVLVIQPGRRVRAVMGLNPMRSTHRAETTRQAYAATRRWIAGSAPRDLLAGLGTAKSGAAG
jgi:NTE family protein